MTKDSHAYITGVYRFSRAGIRFPIHALKPTPEFTSDVEAALTGDDDETKRSQLKSFFGQYGQAFAFTVELGGLLHTTVDTIISSQVCCGHMWSALRDLYHNAYPCDDGSKTNDRKSLASVLRSLEASKPSPA